MRAFAVFTLHAADAAAWIEAGCSYVHVETGALMAGYVQPDGRIACLRKTLGGALGDMARADAAAMGGICIEFDNPAGFPGHGEAYAALARA